MADSLTRYAEAMAEIQAASVRLKAINEAMIETEKQLLEARASQSSSIDQLEEKSKNLAQQYGQLKEKTKGLDEKEQKLARSGKGLSSSLNSITHGTKSLAVEMGVTGFGIKEVIQRTIELNRYTFQYARQLQVSGRGAGNFAKALENITAKTTLSRKDFMQLSAELSHLHAGVLPNVNAIEDMAIALQQSFGPNVDITIAKMKELTQVLEQQPSLYYAIRDAQEQMVRGNYTSEMENANKAMVDALALAKGLSATQTRAFAEFVTKPTDEIEEKTSPEKGIAKNSQAIENLTTSIGKELTPAIDALTGTLNPVTSRLELLASEIVVLSGVLVAARFLDPIKSAGMASVNAVKNLASIFTKGQASALAGGLPGIPAGGVGKGLLGGLGSVGGATLKALGKNLTGNLGAAIGGSALSGLGGLLTGLSEARKSKTEALRLGKSDEEANKYARGRGLKIGGATGGFAMGGAVLGTMIAGPIGTAVGAGVGGALGKFLGGKWAGETLTERKENKDAEDLEDSLNNINKNQKLYNESIQESINLLNDRTDVFNKQIEASQKILEIHTELRRELSGGDEIDYSMIFDTLNSKMRETRKTLTTVIEDSANLLKNTLANNRIFDDVVVTFKGQLEGLDEKPLDEQLDIIRSFIQETQNVVSAMEEDGIDTSQFNTAFSGIKTSYQNLNAEMNSITASTQEALRSQWEQVADAGEKGLEPYKRLIDAQRDFVEAAQFGIGASISMLQKQIDMEEKHIRLQEKSIENAKRGIDQQFAKTNVSEDELKVLKNIAETSMDHNVIIERANLLLTDNVADEQTRKQLVQSLVTYGESFANSNAKVLEHQKKIYELTKDIREGYLDVIKESATNLGDFEAIIGTNEKAVTQLMKITRSVLGYDAQNTFALGGMGGSEARQSPYGMFTTSGLQTRNFTAAEQADIYRYGELPTEHVAGTAQGPERQITGSRAYLDSRWDRGGGLALDYNPQAVNADKVHQALGRPLTVNSASIPTIREGAAPAYTFPEDHPYQNYLSPVSNDPDFTPRATPPSILPKLDNTIRDFQPRNETMTELRDRINAEKSHTSASTSTSPSLDPAILSPFLSLAQNVMPSVSQPLFAEIKISLTPELAGQLLAASNLAVEIGNTV